MWVPRNDQRVACVLGRLAILSLGCLACEVRSQGVPPVTTFATPPRQAGAEHADFGSEMSLYLATTLNTRNMDLQPAQWRDGDIWMQRDTLLAMGLKSESLDAATNRSGDWIALSSLPRASVAFNAALQRLDLVLPFSELRWASTELATTSTRTQKASASPGLLVNYDLFGYSSGTSRSLSANSEVRYFRANSVLSNTMLSRYVQTGGTHFHGTSSDLSNTRLDTTFSRSFQDKMLTLRVGDLLSGALPWTRSTRMGGIQIARNFGLQPYRITTPLPALMGTSALPSDIELYINGIRQYHGSIPAGPFTLNTVPGISGLGNAQIVLTDALGRATTLQYSFYNAPQLLAKGLSDWSAEFGWVRRNYGTASFDYDSAPVASGTWSHGLTHQLTLQGHAEFSAGLANASGGMAWNIGSFGVLSAAAGASTHKGQSGTLAQLGHSWSDRRYFVNVQGTRASTSFRDAASLSDERRLRTSGRAIVGYNHPRFGSVNLGALRLHYFGEAPQRYATLGWSRSVSRSAYANLSMNHNLDDRKLSSVQLSLTWYLGGDFALGSSVARQNGETSVTATAQRRAPSEGGWSWGAQALSGASGGGQARVEYRGEKFDANASVARYGGNAYAGLGASGSLIWMDGHAFASRRVQDAFAVVSTGGVAQVAVKRENVVIGHTNDEGVMLVPLLSAYRSNKLSIDPLPLPAQIRVPVVDQYVTPTDRAGVFVKFDITHIRSASILIHDEAGQPLPVGTTVMLQATDDDQHTGQRVSSFTGYDGTVYFESLGQRNHIEASLADGSTCEAMVVWPEWARDEVPVIGPIHCVRR